MVYLLELQVQVQVQVQSAGDFEVQSAGAMQVHGMQEYGRCRMQSAD
jgi:hypothetical protein